MFDLVNNNNRLKRKELVAVTINFIDKINEYEIFKIPDKLYLDYFEELESLFDNHTFNTDERFVTYGRLSFLRAEMTARLHDKNLSEPNSNLKDKWDNRLGAFWDLSDYIRGDRYITLGQVPNGASFHDVLRENDNYYKEGYICKQERDIIMEMIKEFKEFINNRNKEVNEMNELDKTSEKYNINPEDNQPQIVYGIPNSMIQNEEERKFKAFHGGYFGPAEYYFINKKDDKYLFKYGYSQSGSNISDNSDKLEIKIKSEFEYNEFIDELKNITKNWKGYYFNPDIKDGTQWNYTIFEGNIKYSGSNDFPDNYGAIRRLVNKAFGVMDKLNKYEIEPEDNIPREVYGIPSPIKKDSTDNEKETAESKYDIEPKDNVPQRVYGVMNPDNNFVKPFIVEKSNEDNITESGNIEKDIQEELKIINDLLHKETSNVSNQSSNINDKSSDVSNESSNEKIQKVLISIKNTNSNYAMFFNLYGKEDDIYSQHVEMKFENLKDISGPDLQVSKICIPIHVYNEFYNSLKNIVKDWSNEYSGTSDISWKLIISNKTMDIYEGQGAYPDNWNQYIDLLIEQEKLFKRMNVIKTEEKNEDKLL